MMGCYGNYQYLYKKKTTLSMDYLVQANLLRLTQNREMLARLGIKLALVAVMKKLYFAHANITLF